MVLALANHKATQLATKRTTTISSENYPPSASQKKSQKALEDENAELRKQLHILLIFFSCYLY